MSLADTLKEKKGPLPVWAWTALGVALLAGFMILRQKKAAAAAAATAAAPQTGAAPTSLGNTGLSNLIPTAYPMPYQGGDVFVNTQGTPTSPVEDNDNDLPAPKPPPLPTPAPKPKPPVLPHPKPVAQSYVWSKGDTWDSVGKKLNIAPVLLWENNGAPAGFKTPAVSSQINIRGLMGNPKDVYANQASIIAAEGQIARSGKPPAPKPGTVVNA